MLTLPMPHVNIIATDKEHIHLYFVEKGWYYGSGKEMIVVTRNCTDGAAETEFVHYYGMLLLVRPRSYTPPNLQ